MLAAVAASVDGTSLGWCAGCCCLSGAFYGALRFKGKDLDFATRFEWSVRCVEAAQAAYVASAAAAHLLGGGGPLPAVVVQRMAGYLLFDTGYELALPFARGAGGWDPAFLAHHVVGLAAHGLATSHAVLRAAAAHVYLAEFSTPFLHASWMLNKLGLGGSRLFLANGLAGALCYVVFRVFWPPLTAYWFRDPAPWRLYADGDKVHAAFLGCMCVFFGLNLVWGRKLVKMVRSKLGS